MSLHIDINLIESSFLHSRFVYANKQQASICEGWINLAGFSTHISFSIFSGLFKIVFA